MDEPLAAIKMRFRRFFRTLKRRRQWNVLMASIVVCSTALFLAFYFERSVERKVIEEPKVVVHPASPPAASSEAVDSERLLAMLQQGFNDTVSELKELYYQHSTAEVRENAPLALLALVLALFTGYIAARAIRSVRSGSSYTRLRSRLTGKDRISIYEHLGRVGLEYLAPHFQFHGYNYADELEATVTVDDVKAWSVLFKYDQSACRRLCMLLKNGSAKSTFFKCDYTLGDRLFYHQVVESAYGNELEQDKKAIAATADKLWDIFNSTAHVQFGSKYNVRRVAKLCPSSARACLRQASRLVNHLNASLSVANEMRMTTTAEWMKLAGLGDTIYPLLFLEKGYKYAHSFQHLSSDEELKNMGIFDKAHRARILKIIRCDDTNVSFWSAMYKPERFRLANDFARAFKGSEKEFNVVGEAIIDEAGRSKISQFQFENFIEKYRGANFKVALNALRSEFADVDDKEKLPVSEIPKVFFAYDWLRRMDLEQYAPNFIGNSLARQVDIIAAPKLTHAELIAIGVDKVGHRRTILRNLDKLIIHSRLDRRSTPSPKKRGSPASSRQRSTPRKSGRSHYLELLRESEANGWKSPFSR